MLLTSELLEGNRRIHQPKLGGIKLCNVRLVSTILSQFWFVLFERWRITTPAAGQEFVGLCCARIDFEVC